MDGEMRWAFDWFTLKWVCQGRDGIQGNINDGIRG